MTTALALLASTYLLVLFLGLQSLNVNGGHRLGAFLTAMALHPRLVALYRKPHVGRADAGTHFRS